MKIVNRRDFLKKAAIAVASENINSAHAVEKITKSNNIQNKINVLLFTLDDCDANSIGCFGNKLRNITPNIDKVANESIKFVNSFTNSATCQPSRLSLMSGLSPEKTKTWGHSDPLPIDTETLSGILHDNGYFTAIIGKQPHYLPEEIFKWDKSRDFEGNLLSADSWDERDDGYQSLWRSPEGHYKGAREAIKDAKKHGLPFFLNINTGDPHRPWPGSIDEPMFLDQVKSRLSLLDQYDKRNALRPLRPLTHNYSPVEVPIPGYLPDLPGVRVDLAQYYSSLSQGDASFGRILDALQEEGVLDSTAIIILSDQGASFPMSKQSLYPHGTNLGLVIKWPGAVKTKYVENSLLSIVDIMPTIIDLLGIKIPVNIEGKSFSGIITGNEFTSREIIFSIYNYASPGQQVYPMRSIYNGKYIYIYNGWFNERRRDMDAPIVYDGRIDPLTGLCWNSMRLAAQTNENIKKRVQFIRTRVEHELYDTDSDAYCLENLALEPSSKDIMSELRLALETHMLENEDPLLPKFKMTGPLPEQWMVVKKNKI